jgi:hypothetical protein
VTNTGGFSDWTYNYAPDPPSGVGIASTIITWTSGANAEDVQIFDNDDVLLATVPSDDETYDTMGAGASPYFVRSVNAAGNISDLVEAT